MNPRRWAVLVGAFFVGGRTLPAQGVPERGSRVLVDTHTTDPSAFLAKNFGLVLDGP